MKEGEVVYIKSGSPSMVVVSGDYLAAVGGKKILGSVVCGNWDVASNCLKLVQLPPEALVTRAEADRAAAEHAIKLLPPKTPAKKARKR